MTLNEEIRQLLNSYALPGDVVQTVAATMERLEENRTAPGIAVGERAPDFRLPNAFGQEVTLRELLHKGPLVLTFYRGDWCPICNLQLAALQRALPAIHNAGASLAAISPQLPSRGFTLQEKKALQFELLSDPHQETIRAYRLQYTMPKEVQDIYTGIFATDVSEQNADGSWNLPVPGTFVIDREGIVRRRHVTADYMQRMEPEDIVEALEELRLPVGR